MPNPPRITNFCFPVTSYEKPSLGAKLFVSLFQISLFPQANAGARESLQSWIAHRVELVLNVTGPRCGQVIRRL